MSTKAPAVKVTQGPASMTVERAKARLGRLEQAYEKAKTGDRKVQLTNEIDKIKTLLAV